jgi:hypothetical protein
MTRGGAPRALAVQGAAGGAEHQASRGCAFDAEVAGVVLAVVGAAEGGEVLEGVGAAVADLLQVVEVDEEVVLAAGHGAAVVVPGQAGPAERGAHGLSEKPRALEASRNTAPSPSFLINARSPPSIGAAA